MHISDMLLSQVSTDEIDEILDLKSVGIAPEKADLYQRFFDEQRKNLDFIRNWRFIWTKLLVSKLIAVFYLYNNALFYFFDQPLMMPKEVAQPFGTFLSELLTDESNQIWLYVFLAIWLTITLQLLITAAAHDY